MRSTLLNPFEETLLHLVKTHSANKESLVQCLQDIDATREFIKKRLKDRNQELKDEIFSPSVNAQDAKGMSALHYAAERGDLDTIRILLDAKANTEVTTTRDHYTPLHLAVGYKKASAVRILLDAKADVHAVAYSGFTALGWAVVVNNEDIIRMLLDAKSNPNVWTKDLTGYSKSQVLFYVAKQGYINIVHLLLKAGADPNFKTSGATPLHIAAKNGHTDCVKLLAPLTRGLTDPGTVLHDDTQRTPADCAFDNDHFDCLAPLLEEHAHFNIYSRAYTYPNFGDSDSESDIEDNSIPIRAKSDKWKLPPPGIEDEFYFCRGVVAELLGNPTLAEQHYEKSDYPGACLRLAEIHFANKNVRKGIKYLGDAIQVGDKRAPARLLTLAKQYASSDAEETAEILTLCSKIYPHVSFSSDLTIDQWMLLAVDARGNSYFSSPMESYLFPMEAGENATKLIASELSKQEAKALKPESLTTPPAEIAKNSYESRIRLYEEHNGTLRSLYDAFWDLRNPKKFKETERHTKDLEQKAGPAHAARIIVDYMATSDRTGVKNEIIKVMGRNNANFRR